MHYQITLSLTSAALARPRPEIKLPAVAGRAPPTRLRISQADEDGDDGAALFRPYSPAEETVTVPESSRRLFVTLLTVPTLALLAGIITYNPTAEELREEQQRKAMRLRGGGGGAAAMDLVVSMLVLVAVSAAARSSSPLLAAVFSTAPTGVPLSLWLVRRAAPSAGGSSSAALDQFLTSCIKGVLALAGFCCGALAVVRKTGGPPTLPGLLVAGYGSWAAAWLLLRRL
uniref:Uncharacterized protein n=1 Tax=Emiliania huxleyi TaxID=2903 RepID=A0A7S3W566_EMIHU|mmetsp:Transcript_25061/g.75158  ORF Transcript_25061/g.75158 Transcript_25061/m.75158 type:complete len:229 (+) Transcript_25061:94-780(+)